VLVHITLKKFYQQCNSRTQLVFTSEKAVTCHHLTQAPFQGTMNLLCLASEISLKTTFKPLVHTLINKFTAGFSYYFFFLLHF
jgi:hypothetical protein